MKPRISLLTFFFGSICSSVVFAEVTAPIIPPEHCELFPDVTQTHFLAGEAATGQLLVDGTASIFKATVNQFSLGFASIVNGHDASCQNSNQSFACKQNVNRAVRSPASIVLYNGLGDISVSGDEIILGAAKECVTENPTACGYNNVRMNGGRLVLNAGTYWFNDINMVGASKIIAIGKVVIHAQSLTMSEMAKIEHTDVADNLLMKFKGNVALTGASAFNALIYSEGDVSLAGSITLNGAVTAKNLNLVGSVTLKGNSQCFSSANYGLQLTPQFDSTNACTRLPIKLRVTDETGSTQNHIAGQASVKAIVGAGSISPCWSTQATGGTCTKSQFTTSLTKGEATIWLESQQSLDVDVNASFMSGETGNLIAEPGKYSFKPGGFLVFPDNSTNPVAAKMIAGKPQNFTIKATGAACGSAIDAHYNGPKRIKIGVPNYKQPSFTSGVDPRSPEIIIDGQPQTLPYSMTINFVNGVAQNAFTIRYDDAGILSIPIQEATAAKMDSTPSTNNEINALSNTVMESSTNAALMGEAVMHVRPYAFAICDLVATHRKPHAQYTIGMAGAPIELTLRPIIWDENDKEYDDPRNPGQKYVFLNNSFCNRSITEGFFEPDAPKAIVAIDRTAQVLLPSKKIGASDGTISGDVQRLNTETALDYANRHSYVFKNLAIDEIGIFNFVTRGIDDYLGMKILSGKLETERFYAAYFDVASRFSEGIPASFDSIHEGFTYMNQGFQGGYRIYAMAADNKPVRNYHLLDTLVVDGKDRWKMARFSDFALDFPTKTNENLRWMRTSIPEYPSGIPPEELPPDEKPQTKQWTRGTDGTSQIILKDQGMRFEKNNNDSDGDTGGGSPNEIDGPMLPLYFAVKVAEFDIDGTNFRICGPNNPFPNIPGCREPVPENNSSRADIGAKIAEGDFYHGRMRIESFSENEDLTKERKMPVYIEYWDTPTGTWKIHDRDNWSIISKLIGEKHLDFTDKENEPERQAVIELRKDDEETPVTSRRVTKGIAPFFVIAPKQVDIHGNPDPNREQFRYWQKLNFDPDTDGDPNLPPIGPNPDPDTGVTVVKQPWLKFKWPQTGIIPPNLGIEEDDPFGEGRYGFYKGSERIIYRGEKNIRLIVQQ